MKKISLTPKVLLIVSMMFLTHSSVARATLIDVDAFMRLTMEDQSEVILDLLADMTPGGRGASVFAAAGPITHAAVQTAPSDSDTGLITATSTYRDAGAGAAAQSSPSFDFVSAVTASIWTQAMAQAAVSWNGQIVLNSNDIPPETGVLDAELEMEFTVRTATLDVSGSSTGEVNLNQSFNGISAFDGGIDIDSDLSPTPDFSGDLTAYSGEFDITGSNIAADPFDFVGTFLMPVDFADFIANNNSLDVTYAGGMSAASSSISEPSTILMLFSAFGLLVISRRKTPKSTHQMVQ